MSAQSSWSAGFISNVGWVQPATLRHFGGLHPPYGLIHDRERDRPGGEIKATANLDRDWLAPFVLASLVPAIHVFRC